MRATSLRSEVAPRGHGNLQVEIIEVAMGNRILKGVSACRVR